MNPQQPPHQQPDARGLTAVEAARYGATGTVGAFITSTRALIGREAELGVLERTLAGVTHGGVGAVALSGEPGIGKSRMLDELCQRAGQRGWLVLAGRAAEFERDLPFGVFVDAIDAHVAATADGRGIEHVRDEMAGELATVFPSLAGLSVSRAPLLTDERYRAHRSVRALLERLAAPRPLVVALDDLQWADRSSIELLDALLRRRPRGGVLLALALRLHPGDEMLAAALAAAERQRALTRVRLRALPPADARALLGPDIDARLAVRLLKESGGNPFYLEQLARGARSRSHTSAGANARPAVEALGVPEAIASALTDELRSLVPATRELLWGAAVAGDPFALEHAAAAAECSAGEALEALNELVRCELVRPTGAPRDFAFRHPLVRHVVYEMIPAGWRLEGHRRCARALQACGGGPGELAHHLERHAERGDEDAVAVLTRAAELAAARAPASAARWYAAALRLTPDSDVRVSQRAALLASFAEVLAATGRIVESRGALLELLELLPADADAQRMRLIAACARIEATIGRREDAHARLTGALVAVGDRHCEESIGLMITMADSAAYAGDVEQTCLWGERVWRAADALGDRALAASGASVIAFSQAYAGNLDLRRTADVAARMDALSDEQLARALSVALYVGLSETLTGHFASGVDRFARGLRVARSSGQGALIVPLLQQHAYWLAVLGRLADAMRDCDALVDAARTIGYPAVTWWALLCTSWVHTYRGDIDSAISAGEEALSMHAGYGAKIAVTMSQHHLGLALVEAGDAGRARELLRRAIGRQPFSGWDHEALVRCELALGDIDAARALAAEADELALRTDVKRLRMHADRARAAVELATGNARGAAELALSAARAASQIGASIDAARARTLAGRALVAAGERAAAATELHSAATLLDACGADRYRDEAERELRRLGRRFQRATVPPAVALASLSPREREVAALVADGLTNRAIAHALILGDKTIETHMRHIFGKLGVTSRASVARAVTTARERSRQH